MSYIDKHESPQMVENIINEFYSSSDEDIMYMILKKPIQWKTIEDLTTYYNKIVKPVFTEGSSDITALLSSEVFPHIFENDLEPFINTLLEPLLFLFDELIKEERKSIILQCIKSVLIKSIDQNLPITINVQKDFISQYIQIMKTNGYIISHKVLYRDILRYLINISYSRFIPIALVKEILQTTSMETKFDPITHQLLYDSFKLTNYKEVPQISDNITLSQMVVLSEIWYKFNKVPFIYFKFILQNVENIKVNSFEDTSIELRDIFAVLDNFKPLLFTNSYPLRNPIDTGLRSEIPLYLQNILDYLQQVREKISVHEHMENDEINTENGYADEDVAAQQDYLNELQSDTDDFEEEEDPFAFDHDLTSTLDNVDNNKNDNVLKLITKLEDIHKAFKTYNQTNVDLDTIETPEEIIRVIDILDSSVDYNEIQDVMGLVENITKDSHFDKIYPQMQLKLYKGLLTRLKRDKEFVKVLKVGNMKQKIDEGLDIRITIYSILLQTKDSTFTYTLACMILEAISEFGVKEKDPSILTQIETLYKKIITKYGTYLEGIDPEWFETHIVNAISEQNPDLYHLLVHN